MPSHCSHCGKKLSASHQPCPHCGAAQHLPHTADTPGGSLWLPVPALILGILGLLTALKLRGSTFNLDAHIATLLFTYTATMLGIVGSFHQERGRVMSLAGLVLGILGLLLTL